MSDKTDTSILLDIYERLGTIEQQLRTLTSDHDDMEAELDELKMFKSRLAAYIWMGGSIASGVFFFLWEGLKYALDKWTH
jgi:hypothetical protein